MRTSNNHEPTREEFRKLPISERRRILRSQARKVIDCYTNNPEITGIGGGDFVELYPAR
jgi:hypothetical protein